MFSTTFNPLPSSSSGIIVNSDCCIVGGGGRGAIGGGNSAINSNSAPATVDNNGDGSRTMSCGINNVGIVTIKDPSSSVNNGGGSRGSGGVGNDNRNSISNNATSVCCCCCCCGSNGGNCFARFFYCLLQLTRFWGVFAAVVLASVGIDLAYHKHKSGYYLIGESIFLFVLEVTWVVTLFLRICVRNDSRVWKYWKAVTWLDGWRKGLLYFPMGAVPLLIPHQIWLSYVVAGQLFTLALFYGLLSFKGRHYHRRRRRRHKERLLHNSNCDVDSCESKLEEITDILDDGLLVPLPEPIPGSSHSLSDSLTNNCSEPDSILEI